MKKIALILGLFCIAQTAAADLISEVGGGYKLATTSLVLKPGCTDVIPRGPVVDDPKSEHYQRGTASCGGDNPVFIGWPIAWQSDRSGPFNYRVGWFHMSHWFDGGADREAHMDCLCATVTINWSKRKKK